MNLVLVKLIVICAVFLVVGSTVYKPILLPGLDVLKVDEYAKNERNLKLQYKCLVENGPCDAVGRWLKPRLEKGLLGEECIKCTPKQEANFRRIIAYVQKHHEEYYQALVNKYVIPLGIQAPPETPTGLLSVPDLN